MTTRRARRWLLGVCSILIIGGLIDPVMNVARALTIWSVLVLGVGAGGLVLASAAGRGLISLPLMLVLMMSLALVAGLV